MAKTYKSKVVFHEKIMNLKQNLGTFCYNKLWKNSFRKKVFKFAWIYLMISGVKTPIFKCPVTLENRHNRAFFWHFWIAFSKLLIDSNEAWRYYAVKPYWSVLLFMSFILTSFKIMLNSYKIHLKNEKVMQFVVLIESFHKSISNNISIKDLRFHWN